MASTQLLHGQLSYVDGAGNETIMHPESSASDILVDSKTNKNAEEGQSAIPSDVDTLQKLADRFGRLAFKSKLSTDDIPENLVVDSFDGSPPDNGFVSAKAGKDLDKRLKSFEGVDVLVLGESDSYGNLLPSSEINDGVMSKSLTWSSKKLNDQFIAAENRTNALSDQLQRNILTKAKDLDQLVARFNTLVSSGEECTTCDGQCESCPDENKCCFKEIKDLRTTAEDLKEKLLELYNTDAKSAEPKKEEVKEVKKYTTAGEAIRDQFKAENLKMDNLDTGVNNSVVGLTAMALYIGGELSHIEKYPTIDQEMVYWYVRHALDDITELVKLNYLSDYETLNMIRRALKEDRERLGYVQFDTLLSGEYLQRTLSELSQKLSIYDLDRELSFTSLEKSLKDINDKLDIMNMDMITSTMMIKATLDDLLTPPGEDTHEEED